MSTREEVCAALSALEQCTVFMHQRPDGDTVGSAAALGKALRLQGKDVYFACSDPITPRYATLLAGERMVEVPVGEVIAVDIASPELGGRMAPFVEKADIVIDHHISNRAYGQLNLIDGRAAACGEIVFELLSEMGLMNEEIAECLYVAIATDTGCFLHGNTTPRTHRIAAELMEYGLDITALNRKLFVIKSRTALMVRNRLLDTLNTVAEGRLATLVLSLKTVDDLGATEDDMENIAGLGMNLEGVCAAATLRQIDEKTYKVSLRSDGSIDAARVCMAFGGGGHNMAAGCTLIGSEADCRAAMEREMERYL